MITASDVDRFTAMAGPDFLWAGVRGSSRPASDVRTALREDLKARQGGLCFACGEALGDEGEFCHIVSRGPKRLGWMPGNIGIGHAVCNERQKLSGEIVPVSDMVRPDVVPTEWTPFPILRKIGK